MGASVGYDYGVINFASTRQNFDETWGIFTDVVINPAFEKSDLQRLQQQIASGLRESETDNDNFLNVLQGRIIYANHPYANQVGGTLETIEKFTPIDLQKHHKKILQTSQLLLVVVGDIDAAELKKKVADSFGKLPVGNYKEKPFPALDFSKPTLNVTARTLPTNYIRGVFDAPSISNSDYYAMQVAVSILQSRVFEEVRIKRQLSYAPNAELDTFSANTGNIYVTAVDANQAVQVMLNEIKRLKTEPIDEDFLAGIAGHFLTTYYIDQETNVAQAAELAKYELVGGGWQNSFEFINRLTEVTPQKIQAVSQKYMKNLRFVVVGNPVAINKEIFLQNLE